MTQHTVTQYDKELQELRDSLMEMGKLVKNMIHCAMQSLLEHNSDLANLVLAKDNKANDLEIKIDDLCVKMIAKRQPQASDLRLITAGIRASTDLERMGDLAVNIAEQALVLNKEAPLKPYIDLPKMAEKAQDMVEKALQALIYKDAGLAHEVCVMDDVVDAFNWKIFDELVNLMQKDSTAILRATRLILIARHFERIADHATNVAEEIIFMLEGKDIRHGKGKKVYPS